MFRHRAWLWSLLVVGLVAYVYTSVLISNIGNDVGVLADSAKKFINGAQIFTEIREPNPPLIIWLFAVPMCIARETKLPEIPVLQVYLASIMMLSIALCWLLMRKTNLLHDRVHQKFFLLAIFVALLPLMGRDFGERDILFVAMALPYALATAARASGKEVGWRLGALIGVWAGVGIALKPFFLLSWLCMEVFLMLWQRSWRTCLRFESLGIVLVHAVYWPLVLLTTPYIDMVRVTIPVYSAFDDNPLSSWVWSRLLKIWGMGILFAVFYRAGERLRGMIGVMLTFAISLAVIAIMQKKGWGYHVYPFHAVSLLVIACLGLDMSTRHGEVDALFRIRSRHIIPLMTAALLLMAAAWPYRLWQDKTRWWMSDSGQLCHVVKQQAQGKPIIMLATSLSAFPLLNYSGALWAGSYGCLWWLPHFYQQPKVGSDGTIYHNPKEMDPLEKSFFDTLVGDMEKNRPVLVIVFCGADKLALQNVNFDFVEYFKQDERFARIWSQYIHRTDLRRGVFEVYKLKDQPKFSGESAG